MDHRRPIIRSIEEAEVMHAQLVSGAAATAKWLRAFSGEPMALLKALRFELVGHDPLTGEPLNVVEQLNQTFTILVTLRAVDRIASGRRWVPTCARHQQRARYREHRAGFCCGRGILRDAANEQPKVEEGYCAA
jgi:hypothetical protein